MSIAIVHRRSAAAFFEALPPPGMSVSATSLGGEWGDLAAVVLSGRVDPEFDFGCGAHLVLFQLRGEARIERETRPGSERTSVLVRPGDLFVMPACDRRFVRTHASHEWLLLALDPARLAQLAESELGIDRSRLELVESHRRGDAELWSLGARFAERLASPAKGSRLYAETLATQISLQLLWKHSTLDIARRRLRSTGDRRIRRAVELIRSSSGHDLAVSDLARAAGLSPNYFLSAFRKETGKTPHRFLTECRIARACELLRDPHQSILEVSALTGFSSQSHLTEVFRRHMQTTPSQYRRRMLSASPLAPRSRSASRGLATSGALLREGLA